MSNFCQDYWDCFICKKNKEILFIALARLIKLTLVSPVLLERELGEKIFNLIKNPTTIYTGLEEEK